MVNGAGHILVLSLYYRPDLSACSFRATALVDALRQQAPNTRIDVVTSLPHRYDSFTSQAAEEERDGLTTIRRIRLPSHRSGLLDQTKAFAHFARVASGLVRRDQFDLVFATSSRLMTATLGAWIATRRPAPLYLDIRDIFADTIVDTVGDVLPRVLARPFGPLFSAIERWTMTRAAHVNLVSQGFASHFEARYPGRSFSSFTNGIDEEFLRGNDSSRRAERETGRPLTVVYAGNMGQGQGLHAIIPGLARHLNGRVRFKLIGDGGRRAQLETALCESGAQNVDIIRPMSRAELIHEYMAADVLFLHLNDYEGFKKVLPSKIFEYAALGKPIWAGVSGYAAQFLTQEVSNAVVFPPCDVQQALLAFEQLEIRDSPRDSFIEKYARKDIMRSMAADVLAHLPGRGAR